MCADGGIGGWEGEGNAGRRGKPRRNNVVLRVYILGRFGFQSDFKLAAHVQVIALMSHPCPDVVLESKRQRKNSFF